MAVVAPPVFVSAPALNAPRYGLLSVAELTASADPHWVNGVEFQHNPLPGAASSANDCAAQEPKTVPEGMPVVDGAPIIVWAGFECKHVGVTATEIEQYARTKLAISEGPFIEREMWANATTPLMELTTPTPAGTTALPLLDAVGALEGWLWDNYGGTGVLHVGRDWAPYLFDAKQVEITSGRVTTKLGTSVSFGSYPGTGPDGTPAAGGQSWIVATGQVQARRDDVRVHTAQSAGAYFDTTTNTVLGLAERTYVLTWDAVRAAVLVDWKA